MRWFIDRPWLLAVLAFIILISAWVALYIIADRNKPEPVQIQSMKGLSTVAGTGVSRDA